MTTTTTLPISVSGTTKLTQEPIIVSKENDQQLWQLTVENGDKNALIYFKSAMSDEVEKRVSELLTAGAEVRFYGSVDYDKVVISEMYINLQSMIDVVL